LVGQKFTVEFHGFGPADVLRGLHRITNVSDKPGV
jgi:hypothetical protein